MSLFSTLVIAVVSAFIFPATQRLRAWWASRKNFELLLRSRDGWLVIAGSTTPPPDVTFRAPDSFVANRLSRLVKTDLEAGTFPFDLDNPARDVVILGSTRYNELARKLQWRAMLPYQYVHTGSPTPAETEMVVVTLHGEEFRSSRDLRKASEPHEVDYAFVVAGTLHNGKRLLWLSGIHGAGTEGAFRFVEKNASEVLGQWPSTPGKLVSWLLRVKYERAGPAETRDKVDTAEIEVLGSHQLGALRKSGDRDVRDVAVLCDLGNVLLHFDRERTYRSLAHALGREASDIKESIESTEIRLAYERGDLDDDAFIARLYTALDATEADLPRRFLEEFWGDIFWPNHDFLRMLRGLADQGVALFLVSNTNRIHYGRVAADFPDISGLFESVILSYEIRAMKPEAAVYEHVVGLFRKRIPPIAPAAAFFVDDDPENVEAAARHGFQTIEYRSYPQVVTWLRKHGLHVC